ncbi:MAG: hypothetical protein P4L96_09700 [Rhodoferax sp.]|nr:hypothetical protein [Rhodoferax sp.]
MYFELIQGDLADAAVPTGLLGRLAERPAGLVGAWQATAGAGLPRLVLLHFWNQLDDRSAAFAAGSHPLAGTPCDGALLRHEVAVLGPSIAWRMARRETAPLPPGGLYELRIQQVLNGHSTEAAKVTGESTLPLLQSLGGQVLGVFDLLLGSHRTRMVIFIAWPSLETQQYAWARLDVEPRFWRRRDEERIRLRRPLFGAQECHLLTALPGCEPRPDFGVTP